MPSFSVALVGSSGGGKATLSSGEITIEILREQLRYIKSLEKLDNRTNNGGNLNESSTSSRLSDTVGSGHIHKKMKNRRSSIEYELVLLGLLGCSGRRSSAYFHSKSSADTLENDLTVDLTSCCFVVCDSGMDFIPEVPGEVSAFLSVLSTDGQLQRKSVGPLSRVNIEAEKQDKHIAELIEMGKIQALISISSDPHGVNKQSINAAILKGIPIVGTGGTSISFINNSGGLVIGSSGGSVATTHSSKAVCFAAALASYWDLDYYPANNLTNSIMSISPIAGAVLPIFLGTAVLKLFIKLLLHGVNLWASKYPQQCVAQTILQSSLQTIPDVTTNPTSSYQNNKTKLRNFIISTISIFRKKIINSNIDTSSNTFNTISNKSTCLSSIMGYIMTEIISWSNRMNLTLTSRVLPIVLCAIVSSEVSGFSELGMIAGATAGSLLAESILAAYFGGIICGILLPIFLVVCARKSLLPTTSTIISIAGAAFISGCIMSIFSPTLALLSDSFRSSLLWSLPTMVLRLLILPILKIFPISTLITFITKYEKILIEILTMLFGGSIGWLVSRGSEQGYYHTLILPIIILEMEKGDFAILGSFDLFCLCLPSAGVCAAVWILTRTNNNANTNNAVSHTHKDIDTDKEEEVKKGVVIHHQRVASKGFLSAILMGDYVEACYPYTLKNPTLLLSIRIFCAISGTIIMKYKIRSSAYFPLPLVLVFNLVEYGYESANMFIIVSIIAFLGPFLSALFLLRNNF